MRAVSNSNKECELNKSTVPKPDLFADREGPLSPFRILGLIFGPRPLKGGDKK